ncbi:Pogo transposable element with KRAB domain [Frankliniella fusca]|uniref:Pogo transposable element with KRAB domain n=1 Tax=Frankliniella fusca TaxID=407009 RepID=A0AAE1HRY2_9NEOP|nr:Pogo transposable element with KRAB domain [Frankliniella fusca]
MLGVTAGGRKLPPFLILKRKNRPKKEVFPNDVLVRVQKKGWMTEELMLDWLKNVWGRQPGALLQLESMLCLDAFRGHLTDPVKQKTKDMKSQMVIIPAGMTSVLQPMDVGVNKPFKDRLRKIYLDWLSSPDRELTPTGKI